MTIVGCQQQQEEEATPPPAPPAVAAPVVASELAAFAPSVRGALQALPHVEIANTSTRGAPTFVTGDLGQAAVTSLDLESASQELTPAVDVLAVALGGRPEGLRLAKLDVDDLGLLHARYNQTKDGLPVVNGELLVHVDSSGTVYSAGGLLSDQDVSAQPTLSEDAALRAAELDAQTPTSRFSAPRLVFVLLARDSGRSLHLAWETREHGQAKDGMPLLDTVYVDAHSGAVVQRHPNILTAANRQIFTFNNETTYPTYPAWLATTRSEGQAATGDDDVDIAYDRMGEVYECFSSVFGMASYNGADGAIEAAVHHGSTGPMWWQTAYDDNDGISNDWVFRGHVVLADGDNVKWSSPVSHLDVLAHEFGHGVVATQVFLNGACETGALGEFYADAIGALCQAWSDSGKPTDPNFIATDARTWKAGAELTVQVDALRYMNDPYYDCANTPCWGQAAYPLCDDTAPVAQECWFSKDHYTDKWDCGVPGPANDYGMVHYNSGIPGLAFKLLVTGGAHPRRNDPTAVTGIGLVKTKNIFLRALERYLIGSATFADARAATTQAAIDLFGANSTERASVETSWDVVGVGCGAAPRMIVPLTFGTNNKISGIAGPPTFKQYFQIEVPANATNLTLSLSSLTGTGSNANLYLSRGKLPFAAAGDPASVSDYQSENADLTAESIVVASPQAGTWYALVYNRLKLDFSGADLTGGVLQVTATCTAAETCDDVDQDCDGLVDENTQFGTNGTGKIATTTGGNPRGILVLGGNAGGRLFVTGDTGADTALRIEKRKVANGALDTTFDGDGVAINPSIVTVGSRSIVVGSSLFTAGRNGSAAPAASLAIEKRKVNTGALDTTFDGDGMILSTWDGSDADTSSDSALGAALASDGIDLFVVGTADDGAGGFNGLIEKRSAVTGALDTTFNGTGYVVWPAVTVRASGIAIDATHMYVIGHENDATGDRWRIEKRWLTTGALDIAFDNDGIYHSANGYGQLRAIAIDDINMYLVGGKTGGTGIRVEARSLANSALRWTQETAAVGADASGIAVDRGFVYTSGYYTNGTYGSDWRIEARSRYHGALHNSFDIDGWYGGTDTTYARAIGINDNHVFVAGTSSTSYWMFQKLKIRSAGLESTAGTLCPKTCTTSANCPSGYYCIDSECSVTPPAITCDPCYAAVGDQCVALCTATPTICGVGTCSCAAPGPYACACPEGYHFNGVTCKPNVECTTDQDCIDLYGTAYTCYEVNNTCYPSCATPEEYCYSGSQDTESCSTAQVISRTLADDATGTNVAVNLAGAGSAYAGTCESAAGTGEEDFYRIYLFAGESLSVTMTGADSDFNAILLLFQAPTDNCKAGCSTTTQKQCVNALPSSVGNESFSSYVAPANGWYLVAVDIDTWDAGCGNGADTYCTCSLNVKLTCPGGTCPGC
ncbi:MAG: M4 family metallopeptidase [Pseudomonadota bacterium]